MAAAAEVAALGKNVGNDTVPGICTEVEVDESGAGNFHLVDVAVGRDGGDDLAGEFARTAARSFGKRHGEVAGKVAVGAVPGALDRHHRCDVCRQAAVCLQSGHGIGQDLYELFFHSICYLSCGACSGTWARRPGAGGLGIRALVSDLVW